MKSHVIVMKHYNRTITITTDEKMKFKLAQEQKTAGRNSSAFKRGRGRMPLFPQELDPLPTQKVPICIISRHPFLAGGPLNFLRAPLASKQGSSRQKIEF